MSTKESYYVDESFKCSYDDEEELKAIMSPVWRLVKVKNEQALDRDDE